MFLPLQTPLVPDKECHPRKTHICLPPTPLLFAPFLTIMVLFVMWFGLFFKTAVFYVALTVLELILETRLALNSEIPPLSAS